MLPSVRKIVIHIIAALMIAATTSGAFAAGQLPALRRYRDLKIYTTSKPDKKRPERIVARTQFVNEGPKALSISAKLNPCKTLRFTGASYHGSVAPGKTGVWQWSFIAPKKVNRLILTGSVSISGKRERDLYLTVQGADPPDMKFDGLERIKERSRIVATYAPRSQVSIDAEVAYRKTRQPKPILTLASKGKMEYTIVVEMEPADRDQAIGDLQRVIMLQSGAKLPIATIPREGRPSDVLNEVSRPKTIGPAIILRKAELGKAAKGLNDAYRLQTKGKDVIIEAENADGLRNGIYGLLTDHLGAHWFQPNQLGEEIVIPKDRTVRLPALNEVRGSVWTSCSGAGWGREGNWSRRNRALINGGRISFGHSWEGYIYPAKYPYDKFLEYYARDPKGNIRWKTPSNFCSTNPEVIDIVATDINNYFRNNPNALVASIDPNDYVPMCLCDRCLALDRKYGQTRTDGMEVADRLLHFSKEIYDRLEPQFKDKYLGILVYGLQIQLPKSAKPHSHHAGIICDMSWTYDHSRPWNDPTSSLNKKFYDLIKGWGKILPQFGYYDYYGVVSFLGPWAMVHKMREDLPAFHDEGGTFLVLENQPVFITTGLNHYISTKLIWDVNADVDMAMDEFFRLYYGPVAPLMRDYWLIAERYYATERPSSNWYPRAGVKEDFWKEIGACLARAQKAAAKLPASQKRYTDRVNMLCEAFAWARLRFLHDRDYGWIGQSMSKLIDHKAGAEFLRKHRTALEDPQKKYASDSSYWPLLAPPYSLIDVESAIKNHVSPRPAGIINLIAEEMPGYSDEQTFAEMRKTMTEIFDFPKDGWRFNIDLKNKGVTLKWHTPSFNDSKWHTISIGKFWEEQGVDYNGPAWYRMKFTAPALQPGKKVFVVVGAADDYAKVWLNGQYLGEQHLEIGVGANTCFALDATKVIKPGKQNVLAVQVDDPGALGGLWKSVKLMVK